jgi:hypothetical protein
MNSFEQIGAAQLLAYEGQRQVARAIGAAMGRVIMRIADALARYLPESKATPW